MDRDRLGDPDLGSRKRQHDATFVILPHHHVIPKHMGGAPVQMYSGIWTSTILPLQPGVLRGISHARCPFLACDGAHKKL